MAAEVSNQPPFMI